MYDPLYKYLRARVERVYCASEHFLRFLRTGSWTKWVKIKKERYTVGILRL